MGDFTKKGALAKDCDGDACKSSKTNLVLSGVEGVLADVGKSPKLTSRPTFSCSLNDDTLYSAGMLVGFGRDASCDEGFGDVNCAGGGERAPRVDIFGTEGGKATPGIE